MNSLIKPSTASNNQPLSHNINNHTTATTSTTTNNNTTNTTTKGYSSVNKHLLLKTWLGHGEGD